MHSLNLYILLIENILCINEYKYKRSRYVFIDMHLYKIGKVTSTKYMKIESIVES